MSHICRQCKAPFGQQSIRAEYVYGGEKVHKFWKCNACELVYLFPVPSISDEQRFYAMEFEKFMEDRSGSDKNWSGPIEHIKSNQDQVLRRWEFLKDTLAPEQLILEVGCSSGFMLKDLSAKGMNVIGIEPSGGFKNFLNSNGFENYNTINELKNNKPGIKFDAILHFFVLEHIRDPIEFLNSQLEILKPGGCIISEVPNVNDPLTSLYNISAFEKFFWSIAHHYYYSPKTLTPILDELNCSKYEFRLDQRYDLSNHITWMQDGMPGGQGRFNNILSESTVNKYKSDLIKSGYCDTFFVYIYN